MDVPRGHFETPVVEKERRVGVRGHGVEDVHTWSGVVYLHIVGLDSTRKWTGQGVLDTHQTLDSVRLQGIVLRYP